MLGREVVIKFFTAQGAGSIARFQHEARTISSPNPQHLHDLRLASTRAAVPGDGTARRSVLSADRRAR